MFGREILPECHAVLLSAQNFAVNAAEAQIVEQLVNDDGTSSPLGNQLEQLDTFFTIIFTMELIVNAYAHWFR